MLYTICIALILIASVLVILAVLVQNPKSGMAANFGASNQVMGVRETTNFLEKFTWSMAIAIVVLSLAATLAMDRGLVADSNLEISKDAKALLDPVRPVGEQVADVLGENKVTGLKLRNLVTGEESELAATGVFVAIGNDPRVALVKDQVTSPKPAPSPSTAVPPAPTLPASLPQAI